MASRLPKSARPDFGGFTEFFDCEAVMVRREAGELDDAGGEKRFRAVGIFSLMMVKGSGDLDEALQESLFRFRLEQPNFFPEFVSFEEFFGVEMREALFEFLVPFRRIHRTLI